MSEIINLQGTLFLLVVIGVILRKKNILPEEGTTILTDLVIYLILPCNIITSFEIEFTFEILKGFIIILLISALIQFITLILSNTLYNRVPLPVKKVLQYATVCSNAGFMGNPIAEGVFGSEGLMFASVFLIPQRIVMWSAGVSYFTESTDRKAVIRKVAIHPCIIAVYIGFVLMITQFQLPEFINHTITAIGNSTTPMSMILIGTILADVNVKSILSKTVLYYSAIRLILIPGLVFAGCSLFHIDPLLTGVSVLLAGMPAGTTTAILARKYNGDYVFGVKIIVFTTLMSLITVPFWSMILK